MAYQSEFLQTLSARGYLQALTDAAATDQLFSENKAVPLYIGFDCTAPSLHVGSLLPIMMLRKLQQCGGKPIVLLGGGTTRVGDPSGKDETRKILTDADIARNAEGILQIFKRFLTFGDGATDAILVNNYDWLQGLNYIEFLRDVGKHFSINRMLSFDSVKLRLEREQNLSFLEFNYMILQAYDFVELYKRYDCKVQAGGSDQWGNIVNGTELGRRLENANLYGITTPLLTTANGAKMGKTADGAVWLNPESLPNADYWQFWRNTADADVTRFLKLFTDLPLAEIEKLGALQGSELNEAKKTLAFEATKLARGEEAATRETENARIVFEQGGLTGLPEIILSAEDLNGEFSVIDALVKSGLAPSRSEARRLITGGAAKINDETVQDEKAKITAADFTAANGKIKLSAGKKKHALLIFSDLHQ